MGAFNRKIRNLVTLCKNAAPDPVNRENHRLICRRFAVGWPCGAVSTTPLRCNPTRRSKQMAQFPAPTEGIAITHFIVSRDVERSRRFYVDVLGGEAVLDGELSIVSLAEAWITISLGSGPTPDKPTV